MKAVDQGAGHDLCECLGGSVGEDGACELQADDAVHGGPDDIGQFVWGGFAYIVAGAL